jgi:uncharacterized membrane protein (DUF485 family)
MSNILANRILNNPKYRELIKRRDSLAWTLSAGVLILYFGFVLLVALAPEILTQKISSGSVIPLGIPIGVGVILGSIILTGIYVRRANSHFDPMIEQIMREASK